MPALLRIKRFELFLAIFGFFIVAAFFSALLKLNGGPAIAMRIVAVIGFTAVVIEFLWIYTFVSSAQEISSELKIDSFLFKGCVYFCAVFQFLNTVVFELIGAKDFFVSAFSWVSFGCYLYVCYTAAYTLATIEQKRDVTIRDFYLEMIGFFLCPIGLWWLQPRINKIFA